MKFSLNKLIDLNISKKNLLLKFLLDVALIKLKKIKIRSN